MKATYFIKDHIRTANREPLAKIALIAFLISLATLATELFAQDNPSRLMARDLSGQSTVSTNQLLAPSKALQAAQRARSHLIAGRIDQAQKEITRALDISPRFALALNMQGAIHLQTRQFENADEEFRSAIDADPSLGSAYLGLAMSLMARNRLEDALRPLNRAASLLPGSWLIYFETALTHLGLGDTEAALTQIGYAERFTGMNPERRSGTAYVQGVAYVDLKDYDRAKSFFQNAVALDPNGFYAALALKRLELPGPIATNLK